MEYVYHNIISISTEIEYKYFEKGDDMSNLIDILEKEILI
jgi:hypothetical protein